LDAEAYHDLTIWAAQQKAVLIWFHFSLISFGDYLFLLLLHIFIQRIKQLPSGSLTHLGTFFFIFLGMRTFEYINIVQAVNTIVLPTLTATWALYVTILSAF
jgi:hypothetical protein